MFLLNKEFDTFDSAQIPSVRAGKKVLLSINPESLDFARDGELVEPHTPAFRPGSRRIDYRKQHQLSLINLQKLVQSLIFLK